EPPTETELLAGLDQLRQVASMLSSGALGRKDFDHLLDLFQGHQGLVTDGVAAVSFRAGIDLLRFGAEARMSPLDTDALADGLLATLDNLLARARSGSPGEVALADLAPLVTALNDRNRKPGRPRKTSPDP